MDLEEWEFLSDDGFIDQLQPQDGSGKKAISRENLSLNPNSMIDMNYFQKFIDPPNVVIPVPVEFDLSSPELSKSSLSDDLVVKEVVSSEIPSKAVEGEKETVSSHVFFKKMRENEFADMKLDSPKSTNKGFVPQIDVSKPQFEGENEGFGATGEKPPKKSVESDEEVFDCKEKLSENGDSHGGLNIWKMSMTGIGALCSFGFACATICVIAMGCRHREKPHDQKLHFQIYTDEKRIKQVVHHAAKLNEAISAVRGAPLSRAHITIGGYFEGL